MDNTPDPEFGPIQAIEDGCQLELKLDCPPSGSQSVTVSLQDVEAIDPIQRSILQELTAKWPTIWAAARKAWFHEYPRDREIITSPWEWVIEIEIASQKTIEVELEGHPIWELGLSGNAGSTVLVLMMEGSEILDVELV